MKITINKAEQPAQEIFKPGTLVVSKLDNVIVLVTMDVALVEGKFSGVTINRSRQHDVAEYQTDWVENCFTLFVGNVILEQE